MTRTFKFRAWDKTIKSWLGDFRIHPDGSVMKISGMKEGKWQYSTEVFEDVELMQFTGLKDKNGKEIYEGDIVHYTFGAHDWNMEVRFEDGGWCVKNSAANIYELSGMAEKYIEFIGNIHENPELIK